MNRFKIYRLLRRNAKLNEKRHPALEQNKVAKVLMYIGAAFLGAYMIFLGAAFGSMATESDEPSLLLVLLPLLLVLDFLLRLMAQQTPMVFIKPYLLMPMPAMTVVEAYLLMLVTSSYNFLWLCMFLPYAFILVVGGISFWMVLAVVICAQLMVMLNSQWYLLVRTLINQSLLWWLLPAAVYAAAIVPPLLLCDDILVPANAIIGFFSTAPLLWLLVFLLLAALVAFLLFNRYLQYHLIHREISRQEKKSTAIKHVSQFTFLERFGQTGEYLKLELKSIMRNKAIRSRVLMSLGLIIMLSAIITYTDVYEGRWILNFWCYYCFSIYAMTALTKVMGPEGNYIDLLMTQRENILMLLKAKYYFHVVILVVPLLIMLPAVISGKFTIMMVLAYLLLTSGLGYLIMFQLAVYNKQTLPLDSKVAGKNGVESGFQLFIELLGMLLPLLIVGIVLLFTSEEVAYVIVALLGLVLTIAHPWWLRNIYVRMMARKYDNLEGFHASR
ncbi:MAG: DUF5687 family protein [Prevotella sp.]|nr:DUF5687 family protein [Prevotella sp.]